MPKVSIIVPVYNVETYLRSCVDSVLTQALRDLEVLLIDDGSTDSSGAICDFYAEKDSRVRTIHTRNAGAAAARNTGLSVATGEFIAFADSDDWIDPDMYETMVKVAQERSCDLVICDCLKEYGNISHIYTHDLPGGFYDSETKVSRYFPQLLMPDTMEYPVTISNCLLLIRRELIMKYQLSFPERIRFSEDLLFGAEVGYYAQSMVYLKGYAPYHYRQNPDSVTHTEFKNKWPILLELYHRIQESFGQKEEFDFAPQIQRCMLFFVYMAMNEWRAAEIPFRRFFCGVQAILDDPVVKDALRAIPIRRLNISWKLKLISLIYQKKYLRPAILLLWRH